MSADMESLGIIFDLQWKKKPGGNNREDVASIGIWDTPDACLDWVTFKSYVCQNLGTMEDIYVAYVDSDGDELPIESECEFQEALKFARQRASKGREVILRVDKRGGPLYTTHSTESTSKEIPVPKLMTDTERDLKKKIKTNAKPASKVKSGEKAQNTASHTTQKNAKSSSSDEKKPKSDDHSLSNELSRKLACIMKLETEKRKKIKVDKDDAPPPWFKKYMQKFKSEVVAEITTNMMYETKQIIENAKLNSHHPKCHSCCERTSCSVSGSKNKKKRTSDEDSSDCALSSDQRDHKLLKKIEKLHKREKKLEKKLDSKLEKLENKTKRRMEKKIQNKSCSEVPSEKKLCTGSRKRMSDGPVGTYLMDAVSLTDGSRPTEMHIRLGERFTKMWEIMNSGTLPWTDKTELRLAWGTSGLEPEATVVKCPILMPGEKGVIAVTFRAPEYPGTFESYWHFYHMGDRFGHWLGCAVIVDSKEPLRGMPEKEITKNNIPVSQNDSIAVINENDVKTKPDQPVDLRMRCEPEPAVNSAVSEPVVAEVDGTDDAINGNKTPPTENTEIQSKERNPEYESDSDDENLSVISGTISLTSDTEEDENFVVVPMPPCFMCDVPLGASDPGIVQPFNRIENTVVNNEGDNDLKDTTASSYKESIATVLNTECEELHEKQDTDSESVHLSNKDPTSVEDKGPEYDHITVSRSDVYAVDMAGHCMPVNVPWQIPNHNGNNDHQSNDQFVGSTNTNGNFSKNDHSSQHTPKTDSGTYPTNEERTGNTKHEHSHKAFHTHATVHSFQPVQMSFASTHTSGNGKSCETTFSYHPTSSDKSQNGFQYQEKPKSSNKFQYKEKPKSSDKSQNGFQYQKKPKSSDKSQNGFQYQEKHTTTSNTTQPSSPTQPQDPVGASVHILPETLVNGAINVASQAFTTARAVLNNLRSRSSEEFAEWNWNDNAPDWSEQPDRSTTECLNILLEMGFTNKILNMLLLQRYDNDIAKVVAELLTYKDNPGFPFPRQPQ